ncbi:MAG: hypothetical protein D6731_22555 [Planctomycetota bacterium]|nr:MAG: hypothetical protein D6731_22555 [Planctomycetota bacterium]
MDEDMDEDEFAWQSPPKKKKKKKSATGRKKRSKTATGSTRRSSGKTTTRSKRRSSTSKTSAAGPKGSARRKGDRLSESTRKKKPAASQRGSGRRRRPSEDDDLGGSGRRRSRSGRPPMPRKKQGANPVVLVSILTGTLLLCAIIYFALNSGPTKIVEDQPAVLQQADDVAAEGMEAFRRWNRAKREGNAQQELAAWREAHSKLTQAVDLYNSVLDKYRGTDDQLPPEYEGYEEPLSQISQYLVDLEKGARTDH